MLTLAKREGLSVYRIFYDCSISDLYFAGVVVVYFLKVVAEEKFQQQYFTQVPLPIIETHIQS